MAPKSVEDLHVWRTSILLIKDVYSLTRCFPSEELYGLTSQTRRAAVSIAANLAEGAGRRNAGDFCRFAQIALGSAYELDTLLEVAVQLNLVPAKPVHDLRSRISALVRQTTNLIRYQQSKRKPAAD